jgi:RNA polymerase sigma-70 factor, ECF subfamily
MAGCLEPQALSSKLQPNLEIPEFWRIQLPRRFNTHAAVIELDVRTAIEEHFPRIHRAALMLTGNPWDADDLAQETFLVMARQAAGFAGRSSLYTWLYGILLNLDRHERRRNGLHRRKLQVLWDGEPAEERAIPAADVGAEVAEWKKSLWAFVARLPDGQRQALVLRFSERLAYSEIAEVLGCPLGTVKSRIFNGLETLREMLETEGADARMVPRHVREDCKHVV